MGGVEPAPGEPKGTPWHPHRGCETVSYDSALEHQDSSGGGQLSDGGTRGMTAGAGILHTEQPPSTSS
jgi:redox-sensitive bicupin YhaK (pirin superfamily)